jgi:hypothetical protein
MKSQVKIKRRDFFKLNVLIGGALVYSAASPKVAAAVASTDSERSLPIPDPHMKWSPITRPFTMYGTPTDIALSQQADVWAIVSAERALRFNRAQGLWDIDEVVAGTSPEPLAGDVSMSFPHGSRLVLARWGRPNSSKQLLLVMGPAIHAHAFVRDSRVS